MSELKITTELPDKLVDVAWCPVCERDDTLKHLMVQVEAERPSTKWSMCSNCGHVFMTPHPTKQWYKAYYKRGYRFDTNECEDPETIPPHSVKEETGRAYRTLIMLKRTVVNAKHHLDVGSSTGVLIAGVYDKYAPEYQVGIEPNDAWRTFAGNMYIKAKEQDSSITLDQTKLVSSLRKVGRSPKFNLITIVHTLEHMIDPLDYLRTLREHYIRSDGYIYVEVPYLFGGKMSSLVFPHLHAFQWGGLKLLLENAGWHVTTMETTGNVPNLYPAPQGIIAIAGARPQPHTVQNILRQFTLYRMHMMEIKNQVAEKRRYLVG